LDFSTERDLKTGQVFRSSDDVFFSPDSRLLIADIKNCRLLLLDPKSGATTKFGTDGRCVHHPPESFGSLNGAFPMEDGRYLIIEINGDWVDAMSLDGTVTWSTHASGLAYPSDTSEVEPNVYLTVDHTLLGYALTNGDVIATDDRNYRVIVVDPKTNKIVWQHGKYRIKGTGAAYLNKPDVLDLLPPNPLLNGS
jgi:hypothetical protein